MTDPGDVTPAQLRDLAARAAQLVDAIEAARAGLAGDNHTRQTGYRLADAAGWARQVGADLAATADDLARLRSRGPGTCPAEWGCCPDHGGTLRGSGGRSWCTHPGCGRTWEYDRDGQPCTEPAAYEVRGVGDDPDGWGLLCAGHTRTAREQVEGVEVRPLTPAAGGAR